MSNAHLVEIRQHLFTADLQGKFDGDGVDRFGQRLAHRHAAAKAAGIVSRRPTVARHIAIADDGVRRVAVLQSGKVDVRLE